MADVDNNTRKVPILWPNLKRIRAEPVGKDVAKVKVPNTTKTPKQNTNTKKRKRAGTEQAEETQGSDADVPSGAGPSINEAQEAGNVENKEKHSSLSSPKNSRFSTLESTFENLKKNAVDKKAVQKKEEKGKEKEKDTENIDKGKSTEASAQQEKDTAKETSSASVLEQSSSKAADFVQQSPSGAADVDNRDNFTDLTVTEEEVESESVFQPPLLPTEQLNVPKRTTFSYGLACSLKPKAVAYSDYENIQVQQDILNEREQVTDELDVRELLAIEATVKPDLQEEPVELKQVAELVMPLHKVQLQLKEPTQNANIGTLPCSTKIDTQAPLSTKIDSQTPQQSASSSTSYTEWDEFEAPSFSLMPAITNHTSSDDDITDLTVSEDEAEVITSAHELPRAPVATPQHKSEYIDLKPIPMVRVGDYYLVDIPDEILDLLEDIEE